MNLTSLNEITYSSVTSLVAFVHDYQSLIAGLIAIAAAAITTRPVWLQLGRMSIQTNTMLREFLTDRLRNLTQARSWLHDNLDSFKEEVSRRIYEMREIEGKLNVHWAFEQAQIARALLSKLKHWQAERRDPAAISAGLENLIDNLTILEEALDSIHRPASMDQHGEDWSFTDEEWADIGNRAQLAQTALGPLTSSFEKSFNEVVEAIGQEQNLLRDRIHHTEQALLKAGN